MADIKREETRIKNETIVMLRDRTVLLEGCLSDLKEEKAMLKREIAK